METPYLDREIKAIIVQAALQPLSEEQKAILAEYKAIKEALSMPRVVKSVCRNCDKEVEPISLGSMCPSCACEL